MSKHSQQPHQPPRLPLVAGSGHMLKSSINRSSRRSDSIAAKEMKSTLHLPKSEGKAGQGQQQRRQQHHQQLNPLLCFLLRKRRPSPCQLKKVGTR